MANYDKGDPHNKGQAKRDSIAASQRESRRRHRGSVNSADWREATPDKLASAIVAVSQHGFAIRFGYTKDGGAFAIGIIGDGEPFTEFVRPNENIDLQLTSIIEDYAEHDGK